MYYFLFIVYLSAAVFLTIKNPFVHKSGLSRGMIAALFLLKISAGFFIGWMSQKYYPQGNDYWNLNTAGWEEHQLLIEDPAGFMKSLFINPYNNNLDGFFRSTASYWNDLKNAIIIKSLAVLNIITFGDYYLNSIFFNFFGFLGHVALYRIFSDIYPGKKWALLIGCFLLPSTLYFTSGIHKDLLVFTLLGFFLYALYFAAHCKWTNKYVTILCVSFIGLLLLRNFAALALIPVTIAYLFGRRKGISPIIRFASIYGAGLLLLLILQLIRPSFQPIKVISEKQHEFFDLPVAASQMNTTPLEPNLKSLIKNLPQAFNHSFLRPYIFNTPTKFLIPLAVELFIYQLLFAVMLFSYRGKRVKLNDFILLGLFFSVSLLLFTGYIVPNTGSIVRYRSIYLPLLITPMLCTFHLPKKD